MKKILVASDHAGLELKKALMESTPNLPWQDLGTYNGDSVDYPDYAAKLCENLIPQLTSDDTLSTFGVLICGSGQGMAIRANRYSLIRAALCWNAEIAQLAREHNDANVLVLPGRFIELKEAQKALSIFSETKFAGGRHLARVAKLGKC